YPIMFNFFKNKKEPQDIKEVLYELKKTQEDLEILSKKFTDLQKKNKLSIQRVGMVRFNPFNEVGSNQSFSLALLDDNNDGLVITSLYTRQENRIYGKPIKAGNSEYTLSNEENQAIEKATKQNNGK
ncbi:DUF4446 family protein, partial [Patescibacteria group bacterium]|nr:DUF4446 family protein [Patescibacteria group bacterium]MBU1876742.1 DUF4446 family protein [Patescibacteria group bacterium]